MIQTGSLVEFGQSKVLIQIEFTRDLLMAVMYL